MRSAPFVLASLLALACCSPAAAQLSSVPAGPVCVPRADTMIRHVDLAGQVGRFPRDATLDSVWIKLAGDLDGCRILNHDDTWVVQMPWWTTNGVPGCHRVSEIDALAEKYHFSDTTMVNMRFYYYTVRAKTAAEAAVQAKKRQPRTAPREMLRPAPTPEPKES